MPDRSCTTEGNTLARATLGQHVLQQVQHTLSLTGMTPNIRCTISRGSSTCSTLARWPIGFVMNALAASKDSFLEYYRGDDPKNRDRQLK